MNPCIRYSIKIVPAVLLSACGAQRNDAERTAAPRIIEETAPDSDTALPQPKKTETDAVPKNKLDSPSRGAISRKDLTPIVQAGPAALLARVSTEPHRREGRFVGFRITAFHPNAPSAVDLKVGDVVIAVNGLKIVKPDDFFRVFQELTVAGELRLEIVRDGRKQTVVHPIVE